MVDRMTPEQRRHCMSRIKGRNTKPELLVRRYLHSQGFRYRLHVSKLPGTPDIVLRRYRTVIFVNGCFWHKHDCNSFKAPTTRKEFWDNKLERNQSRDLEQQAKLKEMGWHVIRIWECELKPKVRQQTFEGLSYTLNHLVLLNYGAKEYSSNKDNEVSIAAEERSKYK